MLAELLPLGGLSSILEVHGPLVRPPVFKTGVGRESVLGRFDSCAFPFVLVLARETDISETLRQMHEVSMVFEVGVTLVCVRPLRINLAHVFPEHLRALERLVRRLRSNGVPHRSPRTLGVLPQLLASGSVHDLRRDR